MLLPCTEQPWQCVTSQNSGFPLTSVHLRDSKPGTFHSLGWIGRLCVSLLQGEAEKCMWCHSFMETVIERTDWLLWNHSKIISFTRSTQNYQFSSTFSIIVEIGNDWEERKEGKGKKLSHYIAEFIHLFFLLQSEALQSSSPEFPLEMFWVYSCGLYLFLISLPEAHQKTIQFRNSLNF